MNKSTTKTTAKSTSTKLFSERCRGFLDERKELDALRTLRNVHPIDARQILIDGKVLTNFASNDYLGLSRHPYVIERAKEFIDKYGAGCPSSRLVSGNITPYAELEARIAELKGTQSAVIFPSGFQLNSTVLRAMASSNVVFALDRLCHASIIAGTTDAGARWFRFPHNDMKTLENKLSGDSYETSERWIVTESVFSMDGDCVPTEGLYTVAASTNACIYIDEAHATGVFGKNGMGIASELAQTEPLVISMGTFGKGLGSFGAYLACPAFFKDYLINACPGMIYSTALPPAVLGAIEAALSLIPQLEEERRLLQTNAQMVRQRLGEMGFDTGSSTTQIIPIIVGDSARAVKISRRLEDQGIFAPAIRPPTVPEKSARIRLSLSAAHTSRDLERLLVALGAANKEI